MIIENKLIPCKDRLPEEDGQYLVQFDYGLIDVIKYEGGWNCTRDREAGEICRRYEMEDVIAWTYLPDPYRGDL